MTIRTVGCMGRDFTSVADAGRRHQRVRLSSSHLGAKWLDDVAELFLEGQHLFDIIRFNINIQPAAGTSYHFGGSYGTQTCFPLPAAERLNNPRIGS